MNNTVIKPIKRKSLDGVEELMRLLEQFTIRAITGSITRTGIRRRVKNDNSK